MTLTEPRGRRWPRLEWGQMLAIVVGAGLVLLGARGFSQRGHFALSDLLYCVVLLLPAALFLLVSSYVVQHARLVVVLPLLFAALLVRAYPAFAVSLGIALIGAIAGPVFEEWRASAAT